MSANAADPSQQPTTGGTGQPDAPKVEQELPDVAVAELVSATPSRSYNPISWLRKLSFRGQVILILVVSCVALLVFTAEPAKPQQTQQPAAESVAGGEPAADLPAQRFSDTTPSAETLRALGARQVMLTPDEAGGDSRMAPNAIAAVFRPPAVEQTAPLAPLDDEDLAAGMPYVGRVRRNAPIEVLGVFGTPEAMPANGQGGAQGARVSWGPRSLAGNVNGALPQGPSVAGASPADQGATGRVDESQFAPFGRLIKCRLVNTLDSLVPTNTPVVALVTEPVFWNGKEIIPVNTEVFGYVGAEPQIDARGVGRLFDSGSWALVLPAQRSGKNGREWLLRGRVLARREALTEQTGRVKAWEVDDMAPGFIGQTISTLDNQELRSFAASFLGAAAKAAGEISQTRSIVPGEAGQNGVTEADPTVGNAVSGALGAGIEAALSRSVERIEDEIKKRGFYVRVPAGHEFYLFVEQTLDPRRAGVGVLASEPSAGDILSKGGEKSE